MKLKHFLSVMIFCFIIPITEVASQAEYHLVDVYPSEPTAFTQGLEMHEDDLLMGTGMYGESVIGYLDLETGELEVVDELAEQYFGEGLTVTPNYVWQLTWRENTAFKRDLETLEVIDTMEYEGEGWGLAYDEDRDTLWLSDGTNVIERRHPETFELLGEINVTINDEPLMQINELEYANGWIYANVWYTHAIVLINPETGKVEHVFDLGPLHHEHFTEEELMQLDTLNGIAHIEDNRFYITGKLYPVVFELELLVE